MSGAERGGAALFANTPGGSLCQAGSPCPPLGMCTKAKEHTPPAFSRYERILPVSNYTVGAGKCAPMYAVVGNGCGGERAAAEKEGARSHLPVAPLPAVHILPCSHTNPNARAIRR